MRIIAVEENKEKLQGLKKQIAFISPHSVFTGYGSAEDVLANLKKIQPDTAFLRVDPEKQEISGILLGRILRAVFPRINLIIMADSEAYSAEAFQLRASGYLCDPITQEAVRTELKGLRYQPEEEDGRLRVTEDEEVFLNQERLRFKYDKTRKHAVYLIGRPGLTSTLSELEEILWEEKDGTHRSYLRNILLDFSNSVKAAGGENIIIRRRGRIGISLVPVTKGDP